MNVLNTLLADAASAASTAASLTGNPAVGGVAAALGVAENVATSVEAAQAQHASNKSLVGTAITQMANDPSTVTAIKALPLEEQAQATAGLTFLTRFWAGIESIF